MDDYQNKHKKSGSFSGMMILFMAFMGIYAIVTGATQREDQQHVNSVEQSKEHQRQALMEKRDAELRKRLGDKIVEPDGEYYYFDAYYVMKEFVKNRLKSPSTAKFPGGLFGGMGKDTHVVYLDNEVYGVTSYVDSQNSFGATLRNRFAGKVKRSNDGKWKLIELVFFD